MPRRVRSLGRVEYEPTWRAMQDFTAQRDATPRPARKLAGPWAAGIDEAGLEAGSGAALIFDEVQTGFFGSGAGSGDGVAGFGLGGSFIPTLDP